MAQGLLKQMLPPGLGACITIESAGTNALEDRPAEAYAIQAVQAMGIDISGHRAQRVSAEMVGRSDWILAMEKGHARQLAQFSPADHQKVRCLQEFGPAAAKLDVFDPYGGSIAAYQACARLIKACLAGFIPLLSQS
jgi:protein-tyrosine-phosphatase